MPARSEAGQERTKIRDAPSWFALILRMDAHILLPRSMRPGSRDRSEQAGPQGAGPGPGHRGAPPAAVLAARWGSVLRSFAVSHAEDEPAADDRRPVHHGGAGVQPMQLLEDQLQHGSLQVLQGGPLLHERLPPRCVRLSGSHTIRAPGQERTQDVRARPGGSRAGQAGQARAS